MEHLPKYAPLPTQAQPATLVAKAGSGAEPPPSAALATQPAWGDAPPCGC